MEKNETKNSLKIATPNIRVASQSTYFLSLKVSYGFLKHLIALYKIFV